MGLLDKFKNVLGLGDKEEQSKSQKKVKKTKKVIQQTISKPIVKNSIASDDLAVNRKNHRRSMLLDKAK